METAKKILAILLFSLLIFCISIPRTAIAQSLSSFNIQEMNLGLPNGTTFLNWYDAQSGHHGSKDYFGAYMTLPITDTLYLALGSDLPANDSGDGSYFAKFDGNSLIGIAKPDEQGLHEMIYDGSLIHIAGTDPQPDTHAAGNHYTYNPATNVFTKYRDEVNGLVNVYHTWGLWKSDEILFAAVSAHDGSDPATCNYGVSCFGEIFSSINNGQTWTKLSPLGGYRAYDIIGFNNALYAIYNDSAEGALTMTKSTDGGEHWNAINGLSANLRRVHLIEFNQQLVAVSFDRASLYAVNGTDQATSHPLPSGYLAGITYSFSGTSYTDYNIMAVAKGYLYLIAEKQSLTPQTVILRTNDMVHWEHVADSSARLISIAYWSYRDWLVLASPGSSATLKYIDLHGNPTAIRIRSVQSAHSFFNGLEAILLVGLVSVILGIQVFFHREEKEKNKVFGYKIWKKDV